MLEILILLVLIFVIQLLSNLIRIPFILFILVFSALIGPNGFISKMYNINIIDENVINILSQLGVLLLLYLIGLQMNIRDIITYNIRALGFFLFTNLSLGLALYMIIQNIIPGLPSKELAFILAIVLTFTSTAIYYELAKDYKLDKKPESKLLFSRSIIEDVLSILILAFMFSVTEHDTNQISNIIYKLAVSFVLFIVAIFFIYIIFSLIRDIINGIGLQQNDDANKQIYFSFFISIFVIIILTSQILGFPMGVAAFIAGIISNLYSREFQQIRDSIFIFSETFVSIFLIYIGSQLDLTVLFNPVYWQISIIILATIAIIKTITSLYYYNKTGYNMKNAIGVSFLSLPIGEFTLIILAEFDKIFNLNLINIGFMLLLLSVLLAIFLMNISDFLIRFYERITRTRI